LASSSIISTISNLHTRFTKRTAKLNVDDACATTLQRNVRANTGLFRRVDAQRNIERSYKMCRFLDSGGHFAICMMSRCGLLLNDSTCGGRRPRFSLLVLFCLALSPHQTFERMVRAFERSPMYEKTGISRAQHCVI